MQIPNDTLKLLGLSPTGDLGDLTAYRSRRHGNVWFFKAPPLTPPTGWQLRQRDRFRLAAEAWRNLSNEERQTWNVACRRAGLYVHGYNLWIFWFLVRDRATIATVERHSNQRIL